MPPRLAAWVCASEPIAFQAPKGSVMRPVGSIPTTQCRHCGSGRSHSHSRSRDNAASGRGLLIHPRRGVQVGPGNPPLQISLETPIVGLEATEWCRGGTPTRFGGFQPSPLDRVQGEPPILCCARRLDRQRSKLRPSFKLYRRSPYTATTPKCAARVSGTPSGASRSIRRDRRLWPRQ